MPSFDVVSRVDLQEVDNAVNQVIKEIGTRYDFRGSKSEVKFDREKSEITIGADDKMKLSAIQDMLKQKMVKRNVGIKCLDFKEPETSTGDTLRQKVIIKQGISTDDGRKIVKMIKDEKMKKIQAQIQGDELRISGPKRDDLQTVIQFLKTKVTDLELQFVNFRD